MSDGMAPEKDSVIELCKEIQLLKAQLQGHQSMIAALKQELDEAHTEVMLARKTKKKFSDIIDNMDIEHKDKLKKLEEILTKLRNEPKQWKVAKISGADQYQGGPPGMRLVDWALNVIKDIS